MTPTKATSGGSGAPGRTHDKAEIIRALRLILAPGQVTELRVLDAVTMSERRPHVESGYFDDIEKLADAATGIKVAKGFYFVPNPVNPALLARAENRVRPVGKEPTTANHDIASRQWLLIDVDAKRPAGISSSDAEHDAAIQSALKIRADLTAEGWPEPIVADSGNRAHLLYRIDLSVADGDLVKQCLEALAERFDTGQATIDTSVHNPARIWKLYGTLAAKGDNTSERPHRMSRILESPSELGVVDLSLLESLAGTGARKGSVGRATASGNGHLGQSFDLEEWIAQHDLEVDAPEPWQGGRKWVFRICPWNSDHTNRSAFIIQQKNGAIAAGCHHDSCRGKTWHELRDVVEPGWRDLKTGSPARTSNRGEGVQGYLDADPWPDPLAPEAFYGVAGDVIRAIEPHSEADPAALLVQFLVGFGSIIGKSAHFRAEADFHPGKLFVCIVGTTSKGRKGSSWGQVQRVLRSIDPGWADKRIQSGLSSGEGLIWAVRDATQKQEPIRDKKDKQKVVGYQDVKSDPGVDDKRLLVLESELGGVLRVLRRESNTLSAIIRDAWDKANLRTLTKNSPAVSTGCHISIIGHITRSELRRHLTETDMANGLANRFLWIAAQRSKYLPEGSELHQVNFAPHFQRLKEAVRFSQTCSELRRDEEARALWAEIYPTLSAGSPGLSGAVTSRAEAQVMRLAMLYALLDCSPVIRAEHLKAGLAIWKYAEQSARHVFGSALGDPTADEIIRALRRAGDAGLSRTEIREHFGRNLNSDEISRALGELAEVGLARFEKRQAEERGRPEERWFLIR